LSRRRTDSKTLFDIISHIVLKPLEFTSLFSQPVAAYTFSLTDDAEDAIEAQASKKTDAFFTAG